VTQTSHAHHIDGTSTDDEHDIVPVDCGGPTVCGSCDFDARWHKDYIEAKRNKELQHRILPSEVAGLNSQTLRKISAKLRERNKAPWAGMLIPKYQVAATIYALADAMDGVAKDLELE